ncbi:MAG: acyltransferase [Paludibacter sp.]|nr:acyltransferase [Paludibacter sp.]
MTQFDFDDIRPYNDSEVPAAVARIVENEHFSNIVKFLFPEKPVSEYAQEFKKIQTVEQFQVGVMDLALKKILKDTAKEFTYGGTENFSNEHPCMQISNHRDIMLDSALLQYILYYNNLNTSEITFGSNLMRPQIVVDIGKINKMFKIVRGGTARELFTNSLKVSEYMRFTITEKRQSTWIAQRNGRTKNGIDKTEIGVLKMFAMSSKKDFVENLNELNITPIALSYEYEPCDFFKTREIYITRRQAYIKQEGEDLMSILQGIQQYKGNIHYTICTPIGREELENCAKFPPQERFKALAALIDNRIYDGYKLFKTNYIAHDLRDGKTEFADKYSCEEKQKFIEYMNCGLGKIDGDEKELRQIFLGIYANPVDTKTGLKN